MHIDIIIHSQTLHAYSPYILKTLPHIYANDRRIDRLVYGVLRETDIRIVMWYKEREETIRIVETFAFDVLSIQNMYVFIGIYCSPDESIYVNSIQM